jgi:pimeloyl-ACP methyl ester carboxylesterase
MNTINVGRENSHNIDIHYEDYGSGKPVVLIHGWPLSLRSWEKQIPALVQTGHRVIAYDRRGFGESSQPFSGYNYDTLAEDLYKIITHLGLQEVTLVGFSMGGGEVARYLGKYGSRHIAKAVFMSAIPPALLKSKDNPEGVDGSVFEGMKKAVINDRPAFLTSFFTNFYNIDVLMGKKVSEEVVRLSWNIASTASPAGTLDCISAWLADFRAELKQVNIPVLVMHGNADRILPIEATAKRMPEFVKGAKLVIIEGAPHGMNWTHAEEVNKELLAFLKTG